MALEFLKHAIFEDSETPSVQVPLPQNNVYQALVAKTDLTTVSSLQRINDLARPLETIIPDRAVRMKAVLAQSGLPASAIIADVDGLLTTLDKEHDSFVQNAAGFEREKISGISAEIQTHQDKINELAATLTTNRAVLQKRRDEFKESYDHRRTELLQMKNDFLNLK